MRISSKTTASIGRRFTRSVAVLSVLLIAATVASAGGCPAGKRTPDGQGQKMVTHAGKGVVDRVRSAVDLGKEAPNLPGRLFRLRQLDVSPGGIVPRHSHDERPAHIYIVEGSIVEYASNCRVPIVHKSGEVVTETKGVSHWCQNTGKKPVVLISVDIFEDKAGADAKVM